MRLRALVGVVAVVACVVGLVGCSSSDQNSDSVNGPNFDKIVYSAAGTQGDGAADATITILPVAGTGDDKLVEDTRFPWQSIRDMSGTKVAVSMVVRSLSSDGSVSCSVSYRGITISNKASGDHAVADCTGKMWSPYG